MKKYVKIVLIILIILIIIFLGFLGIKIYDNGINKAHDATMLVQYQEVRKNILKKEDYTFKNIKTYNKIYQHNIQFLNECYTLSGIERQNGYIFIFRLKDSTNIQIHGNFYIDSNLENIDESIIEKYKNIINNDC